MAVTGGSATQQACQFTLVAIAAWFEGAVGFCQGLPRAIGMVHIEKREGSSSPPVDIACPNSDAAVGNATY